MSMHRHDSICESTSYYHRRFPGNCQLGFEKYLFLCVSKPSVILSANVFQSSSSTFSRGSIPAFFASKEGMWVTRISALGGSPTVSLCFVRQHPSLTTQ